MTTYEFDTMTTTVSHGDHPQQRGQKLVDRQEWLTSKGAHGWTLVSTVPLPGDGFTVIVDTMTRPIDEAPAGARSEETTVAGDDVNDEGNPAPVQLDLTDDNAYYAVTQALTDFAQGQRGRAEDMAGYEVPDSAGALAAFELADVAEKLRDQIETQIDALSAPRKKTE